MQRSLRLGVGVQKPHIVIQSRTLEKLYGTQQTHLDLEGQQHRSHHFTEHFSQGQAIQQHQQKM